MLSVFFLHSHILPGFEAYPYGRDIKMRGTVWCIELNDEICRRQKMPYRFPKHLQNKGFETCDWLLAHLETFLPNTIRVIYRPEDLPSESLASDTRILLGLEGAGAIGDAPENIVPLYEKGLRLLQLFHWTDNPFYSTFDGLTSQGRQLLRLCSELGIILDLTHLPASAWPDIERVWGHPLVVSHAVCENVFDYSPIKRRQALSDRQIRIVTERGGLVGIPIVSELVAGDPMYTNEGIQARLEFLVRHIDYLAENYGIDSVCLGPDYMDLDYYSRIVRGCITYVEGFMGGPGVSELAGLLRRIGYTEEQIDSILFRNVETFLHRYLRTYELD